MRVISLLYHGCYRSNHGINIYISREISIEHPSVGLASLTQLSYKNTVEGQGRITVKNRFMKLS